MKDQTVHQYKPIEKLKLKDIDLEAPKLFKKISCPSCHAQVPAENLNLQQNVGKCGSCHVIFSIEDEVASVKVKETVKQKILRPEGVELFYFNNELDITIQQHIQGWDAIGLTIFPTASFFALLVYFIEGAIPLYLPLFLTLIAAYFIFRAFNYSNNKTHIDINDKFLTIKNRPKNLKKDRAFAVHEIDQLYLKVDSSGYNSIYMIINGIEGQKHVKLLSLNTLSKAKFLEQEIERYLNIEDRKVAEGNVL